MLFKPFFYVFLSFLLITTFSFSQEKPIEIIVVKENGKLIFNCVNNSKYPYEITFKIKEAKGLRGNRYPITKIIEPQTTQQLKTFTFKGSYSYDYSFNHKIPSDVFKDPSFELTDGTKINEGIVVFNNTDCSRCNRTTSYLLENDIDFKLIDVSNNTENKNLMRSIVRGSGHKGEYVTPVILINGELSHSHENLMTFLKNIKN